MVVRLFIKKKYKQSVAFESIDEDNSVKPLKHTQFERNTLAGKVGVNK